MIRTFVDSGILISAARADTPFSEKSMQVLESRSRQLLTSVFVRLEVYPKVLFNSFPLQRALLNEFFMDPSLEWASDLGAVVNLALAEAERYGLGAMDALHVAAAELLNADELITTEEPGRPIYRIRHISILYIDDIQSAY